MYFNQNPSLIRNKMISYVKLSVNQNPTNDTFLWKLPMQKSYLIHNNSHMRKKQQRGLRTHGRNTNVITISFYLSDLEIQNVPSQK